MIDLYLTDIATRMEEEDLNVVCVLIWAQAQPQDDWTADALAFDSMRALVTDSLIPDYSNPANLRLMKFETETSGLACSDIGHIIGLRVDNHNEPCGGAGEPPCVDSDCVPCDDPPCNKGSGLALGGVDDIVGPTCQSTPCPNFTHPSGHPFNDDGSTDYPTNAITYIRTTNPDAVFGYAHQGWSRFVQFTDTGVGTYEGANWVDWYLEIPPEYGPNPTEIHCLGTASQQPDAARALAIPNVVIENQILRPPLMPMDVVLRRVDFLEAVSLHGPYGYSAWWGAYYKLLNAGQRVSISAGTDADCSMFNVRTAVLVDGPLTYDGWVDGLKAGRTSLSDNPGFFLRLELGDAYDIRVGDQVDLASPPTGTAKIKGKTTLYTTSGTVIPANDVIEVVQNGEVVWTSPDPIETPPEPEGGGPAITWTQEFLFEIDVTESCWIAARQGSGNTHTAAIYVILDHKPIAQCRDAEYWTV